MALGQVNERIDAQATTVRCDIAEVKDTVSELRDTVVELRDTVIELGDNLVELRGTVVEQGDALRKEIADARSHALMLNESTRDDIRLVAEAVGVLTVKVDSLRR